MSSVLDGKITGEKWALGITNTAMVTTEQMHN